nr:biliverdin-producing heme oxygenase [uncultured Roseovarius sp.]
MTNPTLEWCVQTAQGLPRNVTLREELREYTHCQHERLHEHSCFMALFSQSLSLGEYRELTRRLYGFYQPLDRAIRRVLLSDEAGRTGYTYASRSGLLAQDMLDLGLSAETIEESPQCDEAYGIVSAATLGGVLYVIEGATLGGARIDRAVCRLLASDDPAGRRFWSWCRAEGGRRWPMTNRYLESLEGEGAAVNDLKTGAFDTFRLLAEWLAPLDRSHAAAVSRVP